MIRSRTTLWIGVLALGTSLGGILGQGVGILLERVSFDYIVDSSEHMRSGLMFGLLAAALVAGSGVIGSRQVVNPAWACAALAIVILAAVTGLGAGSAVGLAAYRAGWIDITAWVLPNPSRHALLRGAQHGLQAGAWTGLVAAIVLIIGKRGRRVSEEAGNKQDGVERF